MITSMISLFSTLLSSSISPFKLARKTLLWLVVSTPLKNISQLGLLFPIYGKIKNVPNHQPVLRWFFVYPTIAATKDADKSNIISWMVQSMENPNLIAG
jgi:hypothetical protein